MTSRISFSKLVRDELKKLNYLTAIQLVVYGLLIPFRILMMLVSASSDNIRYQTDHDLVGMFWSAVGLNNTENTIFALGAGILCALLVFNYLHSSQKLDFLHSLPIRRERLFAMKYLSGTLTFVISFGISQLLLIPVGFFYGAMNTAVITELMLEFLMQVLIFLGSYSGTILAVMLTGKLFAAVCAVGVLIGYVPLVRLLIEGMQQTFLPNLFSSFYTSQSTFWYYSSPWALGLFHDEIELAKSGVTGDWPTMAILCQLIAVAAVLTAVCVLLCRIRRTESAGSALAFKKTEGLIKLMLSVPAALISAILAYDIAEGFVWELLFILIFGTLACMLMELIYRWDIRLAVSKKRHIILTFVLSAAVFSVFRFDLTGQNAYLPKKDEIKAMSLRSSYPIYDYDQGEKPWGYQILNKQVLDYLESENWELLYDVAVSGVENGQERYLQENTVYVGMKFSLNNGKEVYRQYEVDTELYKKAMEELLKDASYRERYYPILSWENTDHVLGAGVNVPKTWLDPDAVLYEDTYVDISARDVPELAEAYQEDLNTVKFEDLLWGNGSIRFFYERGSDEYWFSPECVKTLEVLRTIAEKQ